MTHEQFMAAGLDQLSAEQLQNLNAWLNRTLVTETTKAATEATRQARQDAEVEQRGFFGSSSDEPVSGQLQGEFNGFAKGRQYQLDNGQRSEERRVGKECVRTGRSRWSPEH